MKKIIVYGVNSLEQRRNIENFLDDGYEIIGYTDGHYERDIRDGKRFIRLEDLCREEFDWILLNARKESSSVEMRRSLLRLGIPQEKIIAPFMFLPPPPGDDLLKTNPDLIADIDANYHGEKGLIFGLSYSLLGIDEKRLKFPFYDCSGPSLDLYYNYKMCGYMEEKLPSALQTVLYVFPYYYFDYDMSMSLGMYKNGHLFSMWRLDDWHNYQEVPGSREYVENYRMFGRKVSRFYHAPKQSYQLRKVYGGWKGTAALPALFFVGHEKTEVENREIFVQFYKMIEARGTKPVLLIPPFYLDAYNAVSMRAFYQKKEKFYRILKELEPEIGKVRVFDYADRFAKQRELFADDWHLNEAGAAEFTDLINKEVL